MVVLSVLVSGAEPPTVGAAKAAEAIRHVGGAVAAGSLDGVYDGQSQTFDVGEVQGELDQWRRQVKRATDLYYAQRFAKAQRAFAAALSEGWGLPDDVSTKVRPGFAGEWVAASLTWVRALQALGDKDEARRVVGITAQRFSETEVSDKRFPAPIVAAFDAARGRAVEGKGTGALDIAVEWPGGPERCEVSVAGHGRGFSPARVEAAATGRRPVAALCPRDDGRTLVRSRPVWVDIGRRRTAVRIVVGGEEQLTERSSGIAARGLPGWSQETSRIRLAAQAAMARTGAKGAIIVGPDPAVPGGGLVAMQLGEGVPVDLSWAGPQGAQADRAGNTWLWWVAGGLVGGGAVAGGYAWGAHREFEDCRGDPACDDRLDELSDRVGQRALVADVMLGAGLLAAGVAALMEASAP